MAKNWVKAWFQDLELVRRRMREHTSDTPTRLKPFSLEKLSKLLTSKKIKDHLKSFCSKNQIGEISDQLDQGDKTFGWLLNEIDFNIEIHLVLVFQAVAQAHDEQFFKMKPSDFASLSLQQAFGAEPKSKKGTPRRELHELLLDRMHKEFYGEDSHLLDDQAATVRATIQAMFA